MKLLLDTHAFIWLDGDPSRLPPKARAACADQANELYLSLASIWEIQIKTQLGRLSLRGDLLINDLGLKHLCIIYPGTERFPIDKPITAWPLRDVAKSRGELR